MTKPKLHHYVPQFHLRRFCNNAGKLWIWDKISDRVFSTNPNSVAAETHFYRLDQYEVLGFDGLEMEKQLSALEAESARLTTLWLASIRVAHQLDQIPISSQDRELFSLFLAVQFLRTRNTRELIQGIHERESGIELSEKELRKSHTELLWDNKIVKAISKRFHDSIWLFARNTTIKPFITSDTSMAFRTGDNQMWLRLNIFVGGTYVVYPLAPDAIMYCYPNEEPWKSKVEIFADRISPVELNEEMVQSENSGQVFMAHRFVVSGINDFADEREFLKCAQTATDDRN